jgi:predicted GNAT family N-acyltransferase
MEEVEYFPIDIEQTSWAASSAELSQLRHEVFVDEQGVSEQEEFDGEDDRATHWIAYGGGGKVLGCARLCDDKVGRMAVRESERSKGVGSALMRNIIRYASANEMESLQLNAQSHAVPFYEGMYFEADGEEFTEAGLPHMHMVLTLKRFLDPKVTPPLPDIAAEDRERLPLDALSLFREQALVLVSKAHRQIRIFSKQLDPGIYGSEDFYRALFDFGRSHPYAEIHVLVRNVQPLVQNGHRLLHLSHHLPSRVQIRRLDREIGTMHTEFMVIDQSGVLYNQSADQYAGYAVYHSPLKAMELIHDFDDMWEHSDPDPELRRLPI